MVLVPACVILTEALLISCTVSFHMKQRNLNIQNVLWSLFLTHFTNLNTIITTTTVLNHCYIYYYSCLHVCTYISFILSMSVNVE